MAKHRSHKTSVTQNNSQKQNNNKNSELAQQNRALFVVLHSSDEQKSAKVREQIICTNGGLVHDIAKKFIKRGWVDSKDTFYRDLIQEGYIGLVKAVDSFDCTLGASFSTHATYHIRKYIYQAYYEQRRVVTSRYYDELLYEINKAEKDLFEKLGYLPSVEEIAKERQMSVTKVLEVIDFAQAPVSLNSPVGDSGEASYGDFIEDTSTKTPLEIVISLSLREYLHAMLRALDKQELDVIELRYGIVDGEACKLNAIAEFLNLPYRKVRQLEANALMKLRMLMASEFDEDFVSSVA
ncbi:MAG: sigma-70 family RNA polymerase sigma factor [Akkermansia sp.]|nr:sigma-70 family RNA polymerase sigma factor [Akkermansia sp.]